MSPELQAALLELFELWWDHVVVLESANPAYSFISHEDVRAMDEASENVKARLDG